MSALTVADKRDDFRRDLRQRENQFNAVLPANLSFARFEQIVYLATVRNADILQCTRSSILLSCMQAAELGLEVGGVLGEAFLVPFRNQSGGHDCTLIIGYKGLISLAYQSPRVLGISANVVYADEEFDVVDGSKPAIFHKPKLGVARDRKGADVIAAYAVAQLTGGAHIQFAMARSDLEHTRTTSKSIKKPSSPWHTHTVAMYRKTPLRRLSSTLPLSDGLRRGLEIDGDADREERTRMSLADKLGVRDGVEIDENETPGNP